jgi:hypothetical protein
LKRALVFAAASVFYVLAAWAVRPGFYDGLAAPQYDYVAPPPDLAAFNVQPTSGEGKVGPPGGVVATRDQPIAQAGVRMAAGALSAPATIQIKPFKPPQPASVKLEGNAYCISADEPLNAGAKVEVTLLVPPNEPFPTAMYRAESLDGAWTSIGGNVDLNTYLMSAAASAFGCFAVGYPPPKSTGLGIRGSILPLVTAVLIAVVVLAGLPAALRRRYNRPGRVR